MERGVRVAGRYEVLNRLGRGGMGEVWAARDHTLHRDIALKLLDLDGAGDPELVQRFEREAVAAAQISHPNVVALHDKGTHEDLLYIVMEKVDGGTLTETIRAESPLPLDRALEIADEICTALAAAHQARVIHYDIKPHNVMLTPDGRVKVVDFGIAGFIQATFSIANSSQLSPAGTIEYGAPEQFLHERGDERSDLYALGGVLFTMLTGRPPFTGQNAVAVMRSKLDEDAPRVDSFRSDVPPSITELIAELLDRDPDRRPQSAGAVHERLQRLRASEAPTQNAAPQPRPTVVEPPPRRTRMVTDAQPPPEPRGPFSISWKGTEPLDDYLNTRNYKWILTAFVVGFIGCAIIAAVMISQGNKYSALDIYNESATEGGFYFGGFIFAIGGGAVLFLFAARLSKLLPLPIRKRAWSLQVGPPGIRITRGNDRYEYHWGNMQSYTIDKFAGHYGLRGTGIFATFPDELIKGSNIGEQLARYIRHDASYKPAGWRFYGGIDIRNGMIPLCLLGPMTDQQKAALRAALARYAPGKNDAEAWGQ